VLNKDFIKIETDSDTLDLKVEEFAIGKGSPLVGKSIRASILESEFGVVVIAIKRERGELQLNTGEHGAVYAGDSLIIVGKDENFGKLNEFLDTENG
jgi:voltage-gated potassium channel